ncbi:hypothetical protein B0I35DRAFT_483397 [Stachybotrys elegans]|uniref:MYND-type domain-containing protein n=1 Tax=Stachybotrys elegans TaxID=80388 RepID=A0A8K0SLI0_9HYPO|nr:hypothetical protein B0I35DRAFT_483397 [Stachybotrys elegans]
MSGSPAAGGAPPTYSPLGNSLWVTQFDEHEYANYLGPICPGMGIFDEPHCANFPRVPCKGCYLIAYCSEQCKEAHWGYHKPECVGANRPQPPFDTRKQTSLSEAGVIDSKYWGRYPATDILNLEKNEGLHFNGQLRVLLSDDFGLRHLIYSIAKMKPESNPVLDVTITESRPSAKLARTIFALMLLGDPEGDAYEIADAVIHLWYSSRIPKRAFEIIQMSAYDPVTGLGEELEQSEMDVEGSKHRFTASWEDKVPMLQVSLRHQGWRDLFAHARPSSLDDSIAERLREKDLLDTQPPWARTVALFPPARLAGACRWFSDGLLLPWAHPRTGKEILNPILFSERHLFPVNASQEPLTEWPMELLDYDHPAANDVYGKMYFWLRDLLVSFMAKARTMRINIFVTDQHIVDLPVKLTNNNNEYNRWFDRIELGENWIGNPLQAALAATCLLRHEDENPYATFLAADTYCVVVFDSIPSDRDAELSLFTTKAGTILDEYAPPVGPNGVEDNHQNRMRRLMGLVAWRNWDRIADRYFDTEARFKYPRAMLSGELALRPPTNEQLQDQSSVREGIGLSLRAKQTVVRRWPNRLVHSKTDKPSLRDFKRWIAWPHIPFRWIEWRKSQDVNYKDWLKWWVYGKQRPHWGQVPLACDSPKPEESRDPKADANNRAESDRNKSDQADTERVETTKAEVEEPAASSGKKKKNKKKKKGKDKVPASVEEGTEAKTVTDDKATNDGTINAKAAEEQITDGKVEDAAAETTSMAEKQETSQATLDTAIPSPRPSPVPEDHSKTAKEEGGAAETKTPMGEQDVVDVESVGVSSESTLDFDRGASDVNERAQTPISDIKGNSQARTPNSTLSPSSQKPPSASESQQGVDETVAEPESNLDCTNETEDSTLTPKDLKDAGEVAAAPVAPKPDAMNEVVSKGKGKASPVEETPPNSDSMPKDKGKQKEADKELGVTEPTIERAMQLKPCLRFRRSRDAQAEQDQFESGPSRPTPVRTTKPATHPPIPSYQIWTRARQEAMEEAQRHWGRDAGKSWEDIFEEEQEEAEQQERERKKQEGFDAWKTVVTRKQKGSGKGPGREEAGKGKGKGKEIVRWR